MGISNRLRSPLRRVGFYSAAMARDLVPRTFWHARKARWFEKVLAHGVDDDLRSRVNYYNKLKQHTPLSEDAVRIDSVSRSASYYYYDLRRDTLAFDQDLRLHPLFGDIAHVPDRPSLVKSRPIGSHNENSVLLKLNRLRHFQLYRDPYGFEDKSPRAVWRGSAHSQLRRDLLRFYGGRSDHDIGHVGAPRENLASKSRMSPQDQMRFRYIISVEGNDVATNTIWIMASNSVCMMPKPRFETWFMEGRLEPYIHYVPLRDDLTDLDERIAWCEAHREEAKRIVRAAQAHVSQFFQPGREALISLLVLQKYFERTGQLEPASLSASLFD